MISLLLFLLAAYGALALFALLVAERVIFQPPPPSYGVGDLPIVRVPVGAGEWIAVLHLPAPDAGFTVLFSHGNAEDLGHVMPVLRVIRAAGFGVVAYDYRGYGRSSATRPGVRRANADAEAAHHHAVEALGIPADRLILHGRSLGTGPTIELAVRHGAAGVVLESAFSSTYRIVTRVPVLPGDRFRNLDRIRGVNAPVLVIHGLEDRVIPIAHGRQLFAAAAPPKRALWVDRAGHNDVAFIAGRRYGRALGELAQLAAAGQVER